MYGEGRWTGDCVGRDGGLVIVCMRRDGGLVIVWGGTVDW